jgi:DNA invertase Pin-like site-specific DNA recombinase
MNTLPTNPKELIAALTQATKEQTSVDPTKFRYVIYARKSTEDQEKQVRSLPDQIIECQDFAKQNNLKVVDVIQESASAKESGNRPKFRTMLEKIQAGKYDGVIAWHPDRLSRNMKEAGEIIDLLDKKIIRDLKFKSFSFENTASGKMLLGITFVLSKQYSDHLSDSVTRGNVNSIKEGKYINRTKHGYMKDSEQKLRPDQETFGLIKAAIKMRLEGKMLREIADYLNKSNYSLLNKGVRKKFKMNKMKVAAFLHDPVYCGVLMYGNDFLELKTVYNFEEMITVEEYLKIMSFSNDKKIIKLATRFKRAEAIRANLMRGMVMCKRCDNRKMTPAITNKTDLEHTQGYFYYRCENEEHEKQRSIRAKVIISWIVNFLDQKPFSTPQSYDHYKKEIEVVYKNRLKDTKDRVMTLRIQKSKELERLAKIKEYVVGTNDLQIQKQFEQELKDAHAMIEAVADEISEKEEFINHSRSAIPTYEQFLKLWEKVPKTIATSQNMAEIDFLIRKIFLNFSIDGKNVDFATLNEPFATLMRQKIVRVDPIEANLEPSNNF